jgi:putative MATE family efflux protein
VSQPKPLWRSYLAFLAPMMVSNILQALFGTLNSVYLGQMIGVNALAAASVFFPVMFFFIAFIMGLSSGTTVLVGQAFGAGDLARVRRIAGGALGIAVLGGGVIALASLAARPLLVALATPPDILDAAVGYARIMMLAMPVTFVFILATSIIRGVSDTVTPLLALLLSTALGLALTPALIAGWAGLPRLGVASAAVASLVSSLVTLAALALFLRLRRHPLAPDAGMARGLLPAPALARTIARLGLPSAIQIAAMALAELVLVGLVNSYGPAAAAAYGAVNQIMSYVQFPALSIAISASIFASQAIGRGETRLLSQITRTGLALNLVLTGGLAALAYALSRGVIGLFITAPEVVDLAQQLLHVVLWSTVIFGMSGVLSAIMRASGTVFMPMLLSIAAIAFVEVPAALVLSRLIGIEGIWAAYPITFCATFLLQAGYYRLVWRHRPIVRLV